MKHLVPRLTYANVVATLALFIALGGASYAALKLPKNSVGPAQLRRNAVTGPKVRNRSITGRKLRLGSLGTVPSAATLEGRTAEQISASAVSASIAASKLSCPPGTELVSGLCFETKADAPTELFGAIEECAEKGRWLPDMGELFAYERAKLSTQGALEWVSPIFFSSPNELGFTLAASINERQAELKLANTAHPYRCVVGPSN